ncbi:hypothetical protein KDH_31620 [Dictyobacter sp. S3.2.2.5]|uniref:DNA polymerase I n=1 Tax=Dictyobacter halimunensis TaxID=3026934 RepID=A0ABQ6FRU8_9CHLR|nr:hypothetical protein KDH_31620 [Dictyobacter sp. S3.2.2.5]
MTQEAFFLHDVCCEIAEALGQITGPIALDLETTGLNALHDRVVSIMIGIPGRVYILDMRPYYDLSPESQKEWRRALQAVFQTPTVTWIGHNLKFDWKFLSAHFAIQLPQVYDTMLVEQLIHGSGLSEKEFSVSLQQTAARYQISVEKEPRAWFPRLHMRPEWSLPFPAQQLAYMVQDIEVPYRIYERQQQRIHELDLARIAQVENQALPALAAMELRGVLIDQTLWRSMLQKKAERQQILEQEIATTLGKALQKAYDTHQRALQAEEQRLMHAYQSERTSSSWPAFRKEGLASWKADHKAPPRPSRTPQGDPTINLASSTQLLAALSSMGIHVISTRESSLEPYAARFPLIAKLVQWKKLQKFNSSFGENILAVIGSDGRLRGDFAQIGAASGRIICSKPNLQQIPSHEKNEDENIRRCFIAPAGYKLLKADLSNIELRILAEVAQDRELLRLFAEGADLHAETAKLMFNLPPETDTRGYLYKGKASARDIAKIINYGLAYGMGAQGLAARVGVSEDVAKELMINYFNTYAGVARWLRTTAKQALKQGYAVTLAGRRRPFIATPLDDQAARGAMERSAKNHPIQGLNADIIKRALALLYQRLPETAHIVLAVHDEVVLECPEQNIIEVEGILKDAMVQACRDFLTVVHIPEPDVLVESYWKKD